mmetsp:Transcript_42643/g.112247  ORF Transcript_42643/g.112247 Transcript_42643/m.112247 type:complete len:265 (+) Transcript_42643:3653-4447(+)
MLRRGHVRGRQAALLVHLQLRAPRHVPHAPRRAPGRRRRRAQGQLDAHVEGGQPRVHRALGVPPGADLRAAHHRQPRRARGAHRELRARGLLRRSHRRHGGGPRPRACAHGHLHRARHPLLQVQGAQAHGAHQTLLVAPQHSQDAQGVRGGRPVGGAHLPLPPLRRVRQRRPLDDRPPDRGIRARQVQGHDRQGAEHGDLLQGHRLLPRAAADDAQRPPGHHVAAHRPRARHPAAAQGRPRAPRQALPARDAASQHQGGERRAL